jgi:hypothetical protein
MLELLNIYFIGRDDNIGTLMKFITILLLFSLMESSEATTFLTLQSTYLGGGWFQYQMNVMNDPFFYAVDIQDFGVAVTNQLDQSTTSTNYSFEETNLYNADWTLTNWPPPQRPYTETFLLRSAETSWRLATNGPAWDGAIIEGSLGWNSISPFQGAVFYSIMPCLVPCADADADGSPTNYVYTLELVPDITINALLQTNGNFYGLDFTWDYDSTFLLQGSTDLNTWTNISYVWSYPPETIWTTNTLLNAYGQFFRIELAVDGHATNLPPLSALAMSTETKPSTFLPAQAVTGIKFVNGKIVVSVTAQSSQKVSVVAMNSRGAICARQSVIWQGTSAAATFDSTNFPNPVFFNAVTAQ